MLRGWPRTSLGVLLGSSPTPGAEIRALAHGWLVFSGQFGDLCAVVTYPQYPSPNLNNVPLYD